LFTIFNIFFCYF
jgi:hypothetical protein